MPAKQTTLLARGGAYGWQQAGPHWLLTVWRSELVMPTFSSRQQPAEDDDGH